MARALLVTLFVAIVVATASARVIRSRGPVNCTGECQTADVNAKMTRVMKIKAREFEKCAEEKRCPTIAPALQNVQCVDGKAGEYPCSNVDLLSFVPISELGCNGDLNDIWGWTDPETKREYAIVGCYDGTSFVDVTEPTNPQVLGFLETQTSSSSWRDIKVYANHAFIVSEAFNHGMQVVNLINLRGLKARETGVNVLQADAHYAEMGNTHNIVGNEDTGYMYAVGTSTCRGGLHMINVADPLNPQFAGCYADDGYVHDAQCVVYNGPDSRYNGREICFCYNEDTLTIVDVQDKTNMEMVSRIGYAGSQYTHQGWLTEDKAYLLLNDELDELSRDGNPHTRSLIWDVQDLKIPKLTGSFYSEKQATDHNLYIRETLAYEANYCAGLRILDVTDIAKEDGIKEVGYFDVAPDCDSPGFQGSWSSYPYFESKTIIVSSIERGLFVLKYTG